MAADGHLLHGERSCGAFSARLESAVMSAVAQAGVGDLGAQESGRQPARLSDAEHLLATRGEGTQGAADALLALEAADAAGAAGSEAAKADVGCAANVCLPSDRAHGKRT